MIEILTHHAAWKVMKLGGFFALLVGRAHSHGDYLQYKLQDSNYSNTITEGDKDMMSFKFLCSESCHIITAIQLRGPPCSAAGDRCCLLGRNVTQSWQDSQGNRGFSMYGCRIIFCIEVAKDTTSYHITVVRFCNVALLFISLLLDE